MSGQRRLLRDSLSGMLAGVTGVDLAEVDGLAALVRLIGLVGHPADHGWLGYKPGLGWDPGRDAAVAVAGPRLR